MPTRSDLPSWIICSEGLVKELATLLETLDDSRLCLAGGKKNLQSGFWYLDEATRPMR